MDRADDLGIIVAGAWGAIVAHMVRGIPTMRTVFPVLVTGWTMLWVLPPFVLGTSHPPAQGIVWPVIVLAAGWMLGWLRSDAVTAILANHTGRWFLAALGLAPVLILAAVPFAEAGLSHHGFRADFTFHATSAAFFCLPWLVLLFGAGSLLRTTELPPDDARDNVVPRTLNGVTSPCEPDAIFVPSGRGMLSVPVVGVLWFESEQNYVRIHTATREYFLRSSLSDLLSKVGEHRFARIHKSRAVNVTEVAAIEARPKGDAEIVLRSGQRLRMSRRFRNELLNLWRHSSRS